MQLILPNLGSSNTYISHIVDIWRNVYTDITKALIHIGDSNSDSTQTRASRRQVMLEECLNE